MDYKVAILDDEELMREGLVLKYPFNENGYEIVFSDDDGEILLGKMDKNEIQPDVIFVDIIMPKLNGLNFIRKLIENHKEIEIVIVSGFDDFEFAQQAIRLGVKEYLLKPLNPAELESVMQRIKVSLEKKRKDILSEHLEELNNWIMHKNISHINKETHTFFNNIVEENPNLYVVLLGNFKSESMPPIGSLGNHSYPIKYLGFNNLFIHFTKQHEISRSFIENIATKTITIIHLTNMNKLEDLPYGIAYAINLIELNLTLGKKTFQSIKWNKNLIEQKGIEFDENHQSTLLKLNKEKDREKAFSELKKILNEKMPQKLKIEIVKQFARKHFQIEVSTEWLQGYENQEDFTKECIYYFQNVGDYSPPTSGKEILYSVINDIKREFPLKISVKEYAERYHIHPNHLVRLFKQEMETTFNDTLTNIRLDKAKEELLNSPKKVNDIAIDVGYDDARYFSQVFKRYLDMTPSEYRKRFQNG
jgi:two-component system, response regulator YesN